MTRGDEGRETGQPEACPTAEALVAWHESGQDVATSVAAHVRGCDRCRQDVDLLSETPASDGLSRYTLQTVISQGGFGVVCEAWDTRLHRLVAVKLMPRERAGGGLPIEAYEQARVVHPNVLSVLDAGFDGEACYVVFERVLGVDADVASCDPHFTADRARAWIRDVARGLAAVHAQGLVHGDISPRNILVDSDDRARLIDFGMASTDGDPLGGTRPFLAPEAATGVDVRTDVYSLGKTLEWLLERAGAGRRDPGRFVVARACAAEPDWRFASARALGDALRARPHPVRSAWIQLCIVVMLGLVLVTDSMPDLAGQRLQAQADHAVELLRDGQVARARGVALAVHDAAEALDRNDLRVESLLLDAQLAEDGNELLEAATRLAQLQPDADLRARTLSRWASVLEGDAREVLLTLAEEAATEPSTIRLVETMRWASSFDDPDAELPPPGGPYAIENQLVQTVRSLGEGEAEPGPEPADCTKLEGRYVQALCLEVRAAGAFDRGELAGTVSDTTRAIEVLAELEEVDPCDTGFALMMRAAATLDDAPRSSVDDLVEMERICPTELPADKVVFGVLQARALLRLGRSEQARILRGSIQPIPGDAEAAEAIATLDREFGGDRVSVCEMTGDPGRCDASRAGPDSASPEPL